jgi:hypothetical protein
MANVRRVGKQTRFTIFDRMEERGDFTLNPANTYATDESGAPIYEKQEYPKMLYHPEGKEEEYIAAREEMVNGRVVIIPAKKQLISKIVKSKDEEAKLLADGWHSHPAKAIFARTGVMPPVGSDERVKDLEAKLAEMQKERDEMAAMLAASQHKKSGQLARGIDSL